MFEAKTILVKCVVVTECMKSKILILEMCLGNDLCLIGSLCSYLQRY